MDRQIAFDLSSFLADYGAIGVTHHVDYTPGYGYCIRVPEERLSEELLHKIHQQFRKEPVHGVEFR